MPPEVSRNLEGEVDRLSYAITNLTDAVRDLRTEVTRLSERQDTQFTRLSERQDSQFTRLLERQDSHFRWLFGLIFVAAVSFGVALFKSH